MNTSINNAITLLSKHYNIEQSIIEKFLKENTQISDKKKDKIETTFIVPYCGTINDECCKAIIYNHGLYTQCPIKCSQDVCSSCKTLKYGRIEQRLNLKPGELLVLENGKKEADYKNIIKKFNYPIDELKKYFSSNNLNYNFDGLIEKPSTTKKGRGRPRKVVAEDNETSLYNLDRESKNNNNNNEDYLVKEDVDSDDNDEIDVEEVVIDNIGYYLTNENVLLDKNTHTIIGIYKNGMIEKIKK